MSLTSRMVGGLCCARMLRRRAAYQDAWSAVLTWLDSAPQVRCAPTPPHPPRAPAPCAAAAAAGMRAPARTGGLPHSATRRSGHRAPPAPTRHRRARRRFPVRTECLPGGHAQNEGSRAGQICARPREHQLFWALGRLCRARDVPAACSYPRAHPVCFRPASDQPSIVTRIARR